MQIILLIMLRNLFLLCLLLVFSSCQQDKKELTKLVSEWHGRILKLPENSVFTIHGKDTVDFSLDADFKVLVYADSSGCTSCKLRFQDWNFIIEEFDSISHGSIKFLFYVSPKSIRELQYLTKQDNFDYPICVDFDNQIYHLNRFPDDERFSVFLLNRHNKVLAIGNPLQHSSIYTLYTKAISSSEL